jgi:hypothetical protein
VKREGGDACRLSERCPRSRPRGRRGAVSTGRGSRRVWPICARKANRTGPGGMPAGIDGRDGASSARDEKGSRLPTASRAVLQHLAHACESCGMTIETGRYCSYCTDSTGALQSFDERFERMVAWQARKEPEASRADPRRPPCLHVHHAGVARRPAGRGCLPVRCPLAREHVYQHRPGDKHPARPARSPGELTLEMSEVALPDRVRYAL